MAITRVTGQAAGSAIGGNTTLACAYQGNVTEGNLLVIAVSRWSDGNDVFLDSDLAKSAGSATIGAITLDKVLNRNTSSTYYIQTGIYSCLVTGSGSLTLTHSGSPGGSYIAMGICEYASAAGWDASRVEDSDSAGADTGAGATPDMVSAGAAVFIGALILDASGATTITPDEAFTQIYEQEAAGSYVGASFIERIVASGTTDAASWTAPTTIEFAAVGVVYKEVAAGTGQNPAGTANGAATATSGLQASKRPAGVANGTSSSTAALTNAKRLAAVGTGAATVAAGLTISKRVAGVSNGTGTVTSALTVAKRPAGSADGDGVATAALTVAKRLAAAADGVGTATLALTTQRIITPAGIANGAGTATAALTVSKRPAATANGTGIATAALTLGARPTVTLAGVASGAGATTNALYVIKGGRAEAAGSAQATGALTVSRRLVALAGGLSTAAAALTAGVTYHYLGTSTQPKGTMGEGKTTMSAAGAMRRHREAA